MIEAVIEAPAGQEAQPDPAVTTCGDAGTGAGLVAELMAAGFSVSLEGGRLWVRPAPMLSVEARAIVQAHRDAIVAALDLAVQQRRAAIAEVGRLCGWPDSEVAEALDAAAASAVPMDWVALRDLLRATGGAAPFNRRKASR